MAEKNCVEELVNEIHKALENELYVIAVMAALTLPDMCGALEKENFWATNSTYMEWCQKNLPPEFFSLATPELMKEMRNNLLHTGRLDDAANKGSGRLVLTLPNRRVTLTNCRINDDYVTDVRAFCQGLCFASLAWLSAHKNDPIVATNLEKMVQKRDQGLSPYVSGIGVIA
jgi:hypothetical protein